MAMITWDIWPSIAWGNNTIINVSIKITEEVDIIDIDVYF